MRNLGLSANQALHIPGAGDFQMKQMQVLEQPPPLGRTHKGQANGDSASAMEVSASQHFILPDPEQQEQLARENEADELVGEQTWPTDKVCSDPTKHDPAGHQSWFNVCSCEDPTGGSERSSFQRCQVQDILSVASRGMLHVLGVAVVT